MKFYIQQIIYFCLINFVFTFPIFDELWQTNQSEPEANNNAIESLPKIKVEPREEQFDRRWQDESALKGIVKVEHEPPHYRAVKLEGTVKIKHEFEWMVEEDSEFKKQLGNHIIKEDQDGQASKKQQNESNEFQKIESDQQKREIIQKFREMKENYREKNKRAHSNKEWVQIEVKISNGLGVSRYKLYKWMKELGLRKETKFSELEKREILKQFDEIKSKCKQTKLKNISMNKLDEKIAKKLGVCRATITEWKREFGLSVNKKFSDATKIEILKKYAKIKGINPKMSNAVIADMLKISTESLRYWKKQFKEEIKNL